MAPGTHAAQMDRTYRWMRHVYDVTRPFFLMGRAAARAAVANRTPGAVLEIGVGTGRNLRGLANALPNAHLTGLDISALMLETAGRKISRAGLGGRVRLIEGDATALPPDLSADVVLMSYALSMIPDWREALRQARGALTSSGALVLVDFGTGSGLPGPARRQLRRNLGAFHVSPRDDLATFLAKDPSFAGAQITQKSWFGHYAELRVVQFGERSGRL